MWYQLVYVHTYINHADRFTGKLELGFGIYITLQCIQCMSGASVSSLLAAAVCIHMEQVTPVLFLGTLHCRYLMKYVQCTNVQPATN